MRGASVVKALKWAWAAARMGHGGLFLTVETFGCVGARKGLGVGEERWFRSWWKTMKWHV